MAGVDLSKLTINSLGVTLKNTTANDLSHVFEWKIPRGRAAVIPGQYLPIWKFLDSTGAELPDSTEIYFGIMVPSDPRRTYPMGSRILYRPWAQLTVAQMMDDRFKAALKVDMELPYLALGPQDTFVIMLYSSAVCDASTTNSHIIIDIPYFERKPGDIKAELDVRYNALGV